MFPYYTQNEKLIFDYTCESGATIFSLSTVEFGSSAIAGLQASNISNSKQRNIQMRITTFSAGKVFELFHHIGYVCADKRTTVDDR